MVVHFFEAQAVQILKNIIKRNPDLLQVKLPYFLWKQKAFFIKKKCNIKNITCFFFLKW